MKERPCWYSKADTQQACWRRGCRWSHILTDQLNLSQTRGVDYDYQMILAPWDFKTFLRPSKCSSWVLSIIRKSLFQYLILSSGLSPPGVPGPLILVDQLILSQPGDRLCPPHYYRHPRIFRPSYGPVTKCKNHSEPESNIGNENSLEWNTAQTYDFCLQLDFLDTKDLKRTFKGQKKFWRPNPKSKTKNFKIL